MFCPLCGKQCSVGMDLSDHDTCMWDEGNSECDLWQTLVSISLFINDCRRGECSLQVNVFGSIDTYEQNG